MRKYFIPALLCIITGYIMSKLMINQYDTKLVSKKYNQAYFFQVGVFSNVENLNKETSKYDSYIYIKENDKYYVYIGITKNNKDKLKQYFDNLGYTTYIKELQIDENFSNILDSFDIKLTNSTTSFDIKNINKDILQKYGELYDKN